MNYSENSTEMKERLDKVLSIVQNLGQINNNCNIYDMNDLQNLLHVSKRTLATWRSERCLKYSKIGKKCYVTQEQLNEFLNINNVNLNDYGKKY